MAKLGGHGDGEDETNLWCIGNAVRDWKQTSVPRGQAGGSESLLITSCPGPRPAAQPALIPSQDDFCAFPEKNERCKS
ncbi:hypothetical protein SKAU_G00123590 [Synaphobranchus kaupii]|uniref:Uncharacterized protein n=1 Tax=Synaphobranchus kaupii TaxID=118154 RepID=A0A9Q1J2N2_SYNKA|nr:hypothetical protein SKAU_G00123590 [Synaphobranchus kaupii]